MPSINWAYTEITVTTTKGQCHISQLFFLHGRQFGFKCVGDRDAFESAFSEVLVPQIGCTLFFSLVQVIKGSERRIPM